MGAAAREDSRCGLRNSRIRFGEATDLGIFRSTRAQNYIWGVAVPRVYDNIEERLLPTLREGLQVSERADFCVGYLNLRGSRRLADCVDGWDGGPEHCCRLLIGMHVPPHDELREALSKTANLIRNSVQGEGNPTLQPLLIWSSQLVQQWALAAVLRSCFLAQYPG